ncbi:MAG: hypothetical protein GXY82_02580 [Methanospirillum sp.]|nr:hypothetical protein [Methanospirillum sp.]
MRPDPFLLGLILCLCVSLLVLPAAGDDPYVFAGGWSYDEEEKGFLERPGGITGDADGRVYVIDRDGGAVLAYTPSGEYLTRWGARGTGMILFLDPADVSLDDRGNFYVADTGNGRVQAFTRGCKIIATWDGYDYRRPVDVAVMRKGKTYVADVERAEVMVVDENGLVTGTVGSAGDGDGGLRRPRGLALDRDGNLYVLDETLARVTKFSPGGAFLLRFGTKGAGEGQLDRPEGLAIDAAGNVYVADSGNGRIVKFDANGTFLSAFGDRGSGDGRFRTGPFGVWVDQQGTVYVPDVAGHGVQVFRPGPASAGGPVATDPASGNETSPINGSCDSDTCPLVAVTNGTPAMPAATVTAVNITPYGTPTPAKTVPAPGVALAAAAAAAMAGLLGARRRR